MKSLRLIITGRVQGVGFRDWLTAAATDLALTGWVRNTGADAVEAVISGPTHAVDHCVALCWQGPAFARVTDIAIMDTAPPAESGFVRRRSIAP